MQATIQTIEFDGPGNGGNLRDYFTGTAYLEDGETFIDQVNTSFASAELALDWLVKSYRGRDVDGIGILVDGLSLIA